MEITATMKFTVQRADLRVTRQFCQRSGTFEILDSNGDRYAWAKTEQDASNVLADLLPGCGIKWKIQATDCEHHSKND